MNVTPETLVVAAGAVLSLSMAYIPGLRKRYEPLDKETKALIMALLVIGSTLVIYALACADLLASLGLVVACSAQGGIELAKVLFLALVANQTTFVIFVDPYNRKENSSAAPQATVG